jgi:hypothetical protein
MTSIAVATATLTALAAQAHEGHGLPGASHWHATDAWGLLAVGALVALAIWLSRGGK